MPNSKSPKLKIHLDLLRPQSNPEKIFVKLTRWLLSTGRYIFIFVEALVLIAFIARFKLDADLASLNDAIEEQKPYIQSLKPYEIRIRQTQLKLDTIPNVDKTTPDYSQILNKVASQTPLAIKITNITMESSLGKVNIQIGGDAKNNIDISSFINGLKSDKTFSNLALVSIGLEKGVLKFGINATASISGGTNL